MKHPRNRQAAEALAAMTGGEVEAPPPVDEAAPAEASVVHSNVLGRARYVGPTALDRSINTKRTLIPILLTLGVLLPALGSLKWLMPPDSPFTALPLTGVIASIALGAVLLLLAIANMVHVRHLLQLTHRPPRS